MGFSNSSRSQTMLKERHKKEQAMLNRRKTANKFMLTKLSTGTANFFVVLYLRIIRNMIDNDHEDIDYTHLLYGLWQLAGISRVTPAEATWWLKSGYLETEKNFSNKTRAKMEQWKNSLDLRDGLKGNQFKEYHFIPTISNEFNDIEF